MYELLDLNPGAVQRGGRGRVLMAIRPVISVDAILRRPDILTATAGQGVSIVAYHTVPDDEQWLWHGVQASRDGGDRNVIEAVVFEGNALGGGVMAVVDQTAASSLFHKFATPVPLRAGFSVGLRGNGGSTNGDWTMQVLIERWPSWLT